jgi:hypothetical protein
MGYNAMRMNMLPPFSGLNGKTSNKQHEAGSKKSDMLPWNVS